MAPAEKPGSLVEKLGLENGLVDVKVVSVDEDWSALKFVYCLKDRGRVKGSGA